jgi:uncharacterized damage-inducible protein DinB
MALSEALLPEFDMEMATTRKTLERIVDEKFDWQPHEKSMTMGGLGSHLANILTWTTTSLSTDSFDIAPEGQVLKIAPAKSREEMLETFDNNAAAARQAIAGASDEQLMQSWTLLHDGHAVFSLPRVAVLRTFVLSHSIHHRGQLSVYLRLNDISVPSIYGPSADEGNM